MVLFLASQKHKRIGEQRICGFSLKMEVLVLKNNLKIIIAIICLITLIFPSTVFGNNSNETIEVEILLQKLEDESLSSAEMHKLLDKVKQGNEKAVEWFDNLAINDPEMIKEVFKGGVTVRMGETVSIDFGDNSSIEMSLENHFLKKDISLKSYLVNVTDLATYKFRVLGVPVAYYYIWCEYGFNDMEGPIDIIDKWDDSAQFLTYSVEKGGVSTVQDNSNPVIVRGTAEIRQYNATLANVIGTFYCYTTFNTDNYVRWVVY